ncbi:hypothetical protein CKM354_001031800 [Cercospora kikuchii]|uniref:Uncharacterized protein n=1 Tax=Cercospora kikuchii TaxID=84275 RepID=A0A9P3FKT9_9PEZI|nr:uncharacterized protein CKM354_001031800 [Cercospora kikuchii]GIZ47220.1 hypothetical protein CKM354_001031800 [Cercospora kikuchii]
MANSNLVSIAFLVSCCVAFLLSIGGVISAFWALNVDQRWDSYETTGAGTAITLDGRLDEYSGWWFSPMPRVIHDGNERAVAGSSVTILALSMLLIVLISIRGSVIKSQKIDKKQFRFPISDYVVYSLVCCFTAVVGLVYNQAANISSRPRTTGYQVPPPENLTDDERTLGYNGTYNFVGWYCGVYEFASGIGYNGNELEQTCTLATVARWIMIPLFLATLSMVVFSVLLARRRDDGVETIKLDDRSVSSAVAK